MKKTLYLIVCILLTDMTLYAQNTINFIYDCEKDFQCPIRSNIILKQPNKETYTLFSDTVHNYNLTKNNFFKIKGKYMLTILFDSEKHGKDKIDYHFDLNGSEINTEISVRFDYTERYIKKGEIYEKGEKIPNGYVEVIKYYEAPKSIDIKLDETLKSDDYYKGPFFRIKNNSKDTLYGAQLPGYFWGTLSYLKNDSIVTTRIGSVCYEFAGSPPLYPDSTKIASVGSFGLNNKLIPYDYRFEVLLAKKWQSQGVGVIEDHKNFVWWAATKEYYKLRYDFKISDKTTN